MAEQVERVVREDNVNGDTVVTRRVDDGRTVDRGVAKLAQIVWFLVAVLVILLVIRLILALLGANPANAFADFIYTTSNPFVAPFRGLLRVGTLDLGVARFETETLVAIIVYSLIGWLIVKLINLGRRDSVV